MRAHVSIRAPGGRSPAERSLAVMLASMVITGGLCVWAVLTATGSGAVITAWSGGIAAITVSAAVAGATYYAATAARLRDRVARLSAESSRTEQDLARLADHGLPTMAARLRDGAPAEVVLDEVPRPASSHIHRLQQMAARELAAAERRHAAAVAARASLESEAAQLADQTLPALVAQVRAGTRAEAALHDLPRPAHPELQLLLTAVARQMGDSERKGTAAMAAAASAAARIQAQTTRMLAGLRELEQHYGEDKVFGDLLDLDHRISQLGRMADSIALLSGGRSGRRWTKPIAMESILRGAMGRIDGYRRVVLHSASTAAVVGYAAEGVMHALAELLDNATTFSGHGTQVHVYVEEEDTGLLITIEDSGLGMRPRERRRAEERVAAPADLTTLPGTRLGLAVVGRLAGKYTLKISFRPSSRGGTGVVVMIPRQLITQPRPDLPAEDAMNDNASAEEPAGAAHRPGTDVDGEPPGRGTDGALPRRRRGQTLAAASQADPAPSGGRPARKPPARKPPARKPPARKPPGASAARFAEFRQSADRGRSQARQVAPEQDHD